MAAQPQYVKLARSLPPRLTRFFERYPPASLIRSPNNNQSQPGIISSSVSDPPGDSTAPSKPGTEQQPVPNPFQAQKHPVTGRWHDPVFSLRRQADLVKLARGHGVEGLLPFTVKGTEERLRRREENGLRVKGTGVGQRVKGKAWERSLKGR